jgi:NAD(P)-dependent dehydrogenase (short-subunit alcohol dehydrogenase family)
MRDVADLDVANAEVVAASLRRDGLPRRRRQPGPVADPPARWATPVTQVPAPTWVQIVSSTISQRRLALRSVNVLGTVATVDAFLPQLRAASGLRRILLTASTSSVFAAPRLGAYTASKYAVLGYGETLRQELAAEGIGVTIMLPGGMMMG